MTAYGRIARVLSRRVRIPSQAGRSSQQILLGRSFSSRIPTASHYRKSQSAINVNFFSTDQSSSDDLKLPRLDGMSADELEKLAVKFCRQEDPIQAQKVLEKLEFEDNNTSDNLKTSVVDAWSKHQAAVVRNLKESIENSSDDDSPLSEAKSLLEQICFAAECTSEIVESMEKPSSHHLVAALRAWANTVEAAHAASLTKSDIVRGIPQRAQYALSQTDKPTVEALNQVIKAWAYSSEYLRGTMADEIFKQVSDPNGETMKLILRAWSTSTQRRSAFVATGYFFRMMRMLELGRTDMEPSIEDYHLLFDSWTMARDKNAPGKVKNVLEIIENAYQKGLTECRADERCFRDALIAISRKRDAPGIGELTDDILAEMKKRMMFPDTDCYGAAILSWKNVAMHQDTEDREPAIRRTVDLLREMTQAYHRTTTVTVKPTTENYNNVLESLTVSSSPKSIDDALVLLDALESSQPESPLERPDRVNVGPTAKTYFHVLRVLRNQKAPSKLNQSADLLQRMKYRLEDIRRLSKERDIVEAFSEFIRVYGSSTVKADAMRTRIMTMALRILEEMQSLDLQPDSGTYTALLEACEKLLPAGGERQRVLEKIFLKACEEGYVNRKLLVRFKAAASSSSYANLVVAQSIEIENIKALPEAWTRNAKGLSTRAASGGKVLPLSIDGKLTLTKTEAEHRMRKLRLRSNQKMLQGGRIK